MVRLFLQKPPSPPPAADGSRRGVAEMISLLRQLESIISSAISSGGGRHEARLWLCETISRIHFIDARDQADLFMGLLRPQSSRRDVAPQLLQMIFDSSPDKAGRILARKCHMLEKFFQGNPRRILQWFDNFSCTTESGHKKGARALSRFAFANRDFCWEELEWKGKHGQSPAVVATKPHYFQDLDVLRTLENFLEYVPEFWTSDELGESVKGGEILEIDTAYFVDQFVNLMYEEDSRDTWTLVEEFLMEHEFSSVSQKLLILLDENRLLAFLKAMRRYLVPSDGCKDFKHASCWLEKLLLANEDDISLNELVLLNAVVAQGKQLIRLMSDEEHEEDQSNIESLMKTMLTFTDDDHWALLRECIGSKKPMSIKWLGLESWALFYCLFKECGTPQSWEALFISNGIGFRKADDYSLIHDDDHAANADTYRDVEKWPAGGQKKRKREKKKRHKKYHQYDSTSEELAENETSNLLEVLHSGRSWLLSTDGFSCTWNIADLPQHLSLYCFKTWMKWIYSKC